AMACRKQGLDPQTVAIMLDSAGGGSMTAEVDAAAMTLTQLADHIEQTHHTYLKTELPRLVEMAERVARKHGWRDARMPEVRACVMELADDMTRHMQKEEIVLFPLIRQLDTGTSRSGLPTQSVAEPIQRMQSEHEVAGQLVARLRELTDGFTPTVDSCQTRRAMLTSLVELESDLHRHVHKENNILFPRALAKSEQR
ncbi:MAG: hemerythrin domain-containing protein, partial [Opitutaceae bacterium]